MKKNKITVFACALCSMLYALAQSAHAQVQFGPISGLPLQNVNQTGSMVSRVLGAAYLIAAVCMFILLVVGAFGIITSAGDAKKAEAGRAAATSAVVGFLLIFGSYWIIQIVEVITGLKILQ